MNTRVAYLKGQWIPEASVAIDIQDLGFLVGATATERLRTFGGAIFRKDEHLVRLSNSLEILGMPSADICSEIDKAMDEFLLKNRPLYVPGDDWTIAAFVTPGLSEDGSEPTVCVHGNPLPFHLWSHHDADGVATVLADARQVPANCWPAGLKCRSRLHYYLADRQAAKMSPGARAILLDQDGFIGEASTANVVAYYADEGFVTPFISKILPGVSQQVLFELGQQAGIDHHERDLTPEEFAKADEVFLTSTSICLLPVISIEGRPIGDGRPGPVYRKMLKAWSEMVGVDIAAQAVRFSQR